MKKTVALLLLIIATIQFCRAQDRKPTKEETVKYMFTALQGAIGTELPKSYFITSSQLDDSKQHSYGFEKDDKSSGLTTVTYDIPWQEFTEFDADYKVNETITGIIPKFKIKVRQELFMYKNREMFSKTESFRDSFVMHIPNDKIPSFKKAILRLVEIAKEANKDPFAN